MGWVGTPIPPPLATLYATDGTDHSELFYWIWAYFSEYVTNQKTTHATCELKKDPTLFDRPLYIIPRPLIFIYLAIPAFPSLDKTRSHIGTHKNPVISLSIFCHLYSS